MIEKIFSGLNEKQIEAVKAIEGPVLVISGPGSGKTRCLTHRVAFLIASGINPAHILALTFTNKAGGEMKQRIEKLLKIPSPEPMVGTFHSICLRILRREIPLLGYKQNFTILDTDDQTALIKRIMSGLEMDTKKYNPRMILAKISKLKTDLISPESYSPSDFFSKTIANLYGLYQAELKKMNGLDFDDLIGHTVSIFKKHPEVLEKYQERWKFILVDEYQDTSYDQYSFIKLLSQKYRNLFAIGDDAQSIYAFRDADIRNILNFQKDYPDAQVILLEQNYRSTQNIITAAQHIIQNNKSQIPKNLWTDNEEGERIFIKETLNERNEASFIISQMECLMGQAYDINDFTILYRTHAQSRAIEEALINRGFPYQIVGGIKFYERKEIKDMLAYLRVIHNPADWVSFERIYNIPTRGLGKTTYEKLRSKKGATIIDTLRTTVAESKSQPIQKLIQLLEDLSEAGKEKNLTQLIKYTVDSVQYEEYLKSLSASKGGAYENVEERMENLKELLTVAKKYNNLTPEEGREKFLEELALIQETDPVRSLARDRVASPKDLGEATSNGIKGAQKRVTLMTIHSSKGLEFPVVFIAGMEEGLFPHSRSIFDPKEMEEERRLCYVAITRAKQRLFITHTKYRNIFGTTEVNLPSRFIGEMPQHIIEHSPLQIDNEFEEIFSY